MSEKCRHDCPSLIANRQEAVMIRIEVDDITRGFERILANLEAMRQQAFVVSAGVMDSESPQQHRELLEETLAEIEKSETQTKWYSEQAIQMSARRLTELDDEFELAPSYCSNPINFASSLGGQAVLCGSMLPLSHTQPDEAESA